MKTACENMPFSNVDRGCGYLRILPPGPTTVISTTQGPVWANADNADKIAAGFYEKLITAGVYRTDQKLHE